MIALRWLALSSLLTMITIAAACGSSTGSNNYEGPRSTTCSNGPAVEPPGAPDFTSPASLPECIPRCGNEPVAAGPPFGRQHTTASLPSGPGCFSGEICTMAAVTERICQSGLKTYCSFSGYVCRCETAEWRCYVQSQGASACTCPSDAGADADVANADAGDASDQ